jgi:hypothetical protein
MTPGVLAGAPQGRKKVYRRQTVLRPKPGALRGIARVTIQILMVALVVNLKRRGTLLKLRGSAFSLAHAA